MMDKKSNAGSKRAKKENGPIIEEYNSPKTKHTDDNAGVVFSAFVFVAALVLVLGIAYLAGFGITMWTITAAILIAILAISAIHIAQQWEQVVILRLGAYSRTAGPGIFFTIPFIDHIALRADQRVMLTGFSAEETLTSDLVPVNVDAAVFWLVNNAERACLEVEDYYDSVAMAAQTALRDAIGRKSIADVAMQREPLDKELRDLIEDKTSAWGVSILFVEIRDIVIPKELQDDMSAEARAEREKEARIVLAEVEKDIAAMMNEAADVYGDNEVSLRLRTMHLLTSSMKDSSGTLVVPAAYTQGFVEDALKTGTQGTSAK